MKKSSCNYFVVFTLYCVQGICDKGVLKQDEYECITSTALMGLQLAWNEGRRGLDEDAFNKCLCVHSFVVTSKVYQEEGSKLMRLERGRPKI